jgi:hypothetical protein
MIERSIKRFKSRLCRIRRWLNSFNQRSKRSNQLFQKIERSSKRFKSSYCRIRRWLNSFNQRSKDQISCSKRLNDHPNGLSHHSENYTITKFIKPPTQRSTQSPTPSKPLLQTLCHTFSLTYNSYNLSHLKTTAIYSHIIPAP